MIKSAHSNQKNQKDVDAKKCLMSSQIPKTCPLSGIFGLTKTINGGGELYSQLILQINVLFENLFCHVKICPVSPIQKNLSARLDFFVFLCTKIFFQRFLAIFFDVQQKQIVFASIF